MAYRRDGQGMGGGPIPDKTVGWMWGFLCGFGAAVLVLAIGGAVVMWGFTFRG